MLAGITGAPEFKLENDEAKLLASAIQNVGRHYDLVAPQKTIDWMNLMGVVGMVYGTRMFAYRTRRGMERAQREKEQEQSTQASFDLGEGIVIPGNFAPGGFKAN